MTTTFTFKDTLRISLLAILTGVLFSLTACFDDEETVVEEAAEELAPERTTGEKIGDGIEDAAQ